MPLPQRGTAALAMSIFCLLECERKDGVARQTSSQSKSESRRSSPPSVSAPGVAMTKTKRKCSSSSKSNSRFSDQGFCRDMTPQQDSLSGVIICPAIGWTAVKGELPHLQPLKICQFSALRQVILRELPASKNKKCPETRSLVATQEPS